MSQEDRKCLQVLRLGALLKKMSLELPVFVWPAKLLLKLPKMVSKLPRYFDLVKKIA